MHNPLYEKVFTIETDKNLYAFLEERVAAVGAEPELIFYGKRIAFPAFRAMVRKTAQALITAGVTPGDRVVISLITTPEAAALLYACCDIGAVPVLADIRLSCDELRALCTDTGARLLFISDYRGAASRKLRDRLENCRIVVVSPVESMGAFVWFFRQFYSVFSGNEYWLSSAFTGALTWKRFLRAAREDASWTPRADGQEDVVFATSGTTGAQKYVPLTNRQLNLEVAQHLFQPIDYDNVQVVLSTMPLFTCYGFVVSLHLPMIGGKTIHMLPIYDIRAVPKVMAKLRPNAFAGVPGHYMEMARSPYLKDADLSCFRYLLCAGDYFDPKELMRINAFLAERGCGTKIINGYGMTEVASGAVQLDLRSYAPEAVGVCHPLTTLKIVAEGTTEEVPDGEEGEICLRTPCQTRGYLNDPEATAALIRTHPDGEKWVHTGDIGRIGPDGNLYVIGRLKRMVVSHNGTKVFLGMLEDAVRAREGVEDCAAVFCADPADQYTKWLMLFVVPTAEPSVPEGRLRRELAAFCRENLPQYLTPDHIETCRTLPRTGSGKVDYATLAREGAAIIRESGKEYDAKLK